MQKRSGLGLRLRLRLRKSESRRDARRGGEEQYD
jgi:hypothetical protein